MARREWVDIKSKTAPGSQPVLRRVRWCATFFSRLRGLMFRPPLEPGQAILLVESRDSRAAVAIHMFFVPFTIAAVWIDDAGRVVDKVAAQPWRPFYAPRAPARFILETHPEFLERVTIGDELVFEDSPAAAAAAGAGRAAADLR
jgi:uncharacterized membrane protein (UPF0127 family)